MGSRWGRDLELSIPCGTLNTGAVRFVFMMSDGSRVEKKEFYKGDPNVKHAPMAITVLQGYTALHPFYLHDGETKSELRCGFSIEEYID
jgi:hypothetical protein